MSREFSWMERAVGKEAQQVLRTEVTMSPIQVLFLPSLTTPFHQHNQERPGERCQETAWGSRTGLDSWVPTGGYMSPEHCHKAPSLLRVMLLRAASPYLGFDAALSSSTSARAE